MKYVWRRGSPDRWGGVFAVMLRVKVQRDCEGRPVASQEVEYIFSGKALKIFVYEGQLLDLCEKFNNQILSNLTMGPKVLKFAKKKGVALDNYTY